MVRLEAFRKGLAAATYDIRLPFWRVSPEEVRVHVEKKIEELTGKKNNKTGNNPLRQVVGRIPGLRRVLGRGEPHYVRVERVSKSGGIKVNGNGHGELFTSSGDVKVKV